MTTGDGKDDDPVTADSLLREIAHAPPVFTQRADEAPAPQRLAQFRIVDRLGAGGMGVVYKAEDERLHRQVALKLLPRAVDGEPKRRDAFFREARSAAAITHPNVAAIYEVGEADGRVFIAMELVDGVTLRERMAGEPLSVANAVAVARQILRGLARAHAKGIIHRDLKPDNVMLDADGHAKILDFGLAKAAGGGSPALDGVGAATSSQSATDGAIVGTPAYMSPEQFAGGVIDARSDVFSFGVMFWEMLTGSRPFVDGARVHLAAPATIPGDEPPPALWAIVARCLATSPEERYGSAVDVLDALAPFAKSGEDGDAPSSAATAGLQQQGRPPPRRWPALRWVALGVALALAAVVVRGISRTAASSTPSVAAEAKPPPTPNVANPFGAKDPLSNSAEALREYRRFLSDWRDAIRPAQTDLLRAITLDPEFAAAHLRLAFIVVPPRSIEAYSEAFRLRASLDARDLEMLHAEEPIGLNADYEEGERRWLALRAAHPGDAEILIRLSMLQLSYFPQRAAATTNALVALVPTMAGAERLAGRASAAAGSYDAARAHYRRCVDLSPAATLCLAMLAKDDGRRGDCAAYEQGMVRINDLVSSDYFYGRDGLANALTMGASDEGVQAAIDHLLAGQRATEPASVVASSASQNAGEVALWRGRFDDARKAFRSAAYEARAPFAHIFLPRELLADEEMGDEKDAASMLRLYVGRRNQSGDAYFDDLVLQALRTHHVMKDDAVASLRARWRAEAEASKIMRPHEIWLSFDVNYAVTEAEARAALDRGDEAAVPRDDAEVNWNLGRALQLAGRAKEAEVRLDLSARDCRLFDGKWSYTVPILRATFALGQVRESQGNEAGACGAYRRVVDRWSKATPRSRTADAARARRRALRCPE